MPNSPQEKQRVVSRLRRIRGQAEALERAVLAGTDCGALLQQLSALRGASNSLMADVLESHLRETFGGPSNGTVIDEPGDGDDRSLPPGGRVYDEIDRVVRLVRSYLK